MVGKIAGKANKMLNMFKWELISSDPGYFQGFSLVRPHLEKVVQSCNSHLLYDIDKIEWVKWRDTKIPIVFEKYKYEEI